MAISRRLLTLVCGIVAGCSSTPPRPNAAPPESVANSQTSPTPKNSVATSGGEEGSRFVPVLPELRKDRLVPLSFSKDGFPRVREYRSDDGQTRSRVEVDFNGDGRTDFTQEFTEGVATRETLDLDGDGTPDATYLFRKSLAQPEPTLYRAELDVQKRGRPDVWKFYEEGQLVRREIDRRGSGRADYWEYYERGRLVRVEKDENADGRPDSQPSFRQIVKPKGEEPGKNSNTKL